MIKIWEEKEQEKPQYFLRMKQGLSGPLIYIVNQNGQAVELGMILQIQEGRIQLKTAINKRIAEEMGFDLNKEGSLLLSGDTDEDGDKGDDDDD